MFSDKLKTSKKLVFDFETNQFLKFDIRGRIFSIFSLLEKSGIPSDNMHSEAENGKVFVNLTTNREAKSRLWRLYDNRGRRSFMGRFDGQIGECARTDGVPIFRVIAFSHSPPGRGCHALGVRPPGPLG